MKISNDQLELIKASAKNNSIYYQDIRNELIDHLTSNVEELMRSGFNFEQAFSRAKKDVNPNEFQRKILMASHLGFFKSNLKNLMNWKFLLKTIPIFSTWMLMIFIQDLDPIAAVMQVKAITIGSPFGMMLIWFWGGLLKNSQVVSAGNTLWLTICISQVLLNFDFFLWIGFSPIMTLYMITFFLCLLLITGLSQVVTQTKRLKLI